MTRMVYRVYPKPEPKTWYFFLPNSEHDLMNIMNGADKLAGEYSIFITTNRVMPYILLLVNRIGDRTATIPKDDMFTVWNALESVGIYPYKLWAYLQWFVALFGFLPTPLIEDYENVFGPYDIHGSAFAQVHMKDREENVRHIYKKLFEPKHDVNVTECEFCFMAIVPHIDLNSKVIHPVAKSDTKDTMWGSVDGQ
eukprot:UN24098